MVNLTEARQALHNAQSELVNIEDIFFSIEEEVQVTNKLVVELKEELALLEAEE